MPRKDKVFASNGDSNAIDLVIAVVQAIVSFVSLGLIPYLLITRGKKTEEDKTSRTEFQNRFDKIDERFDKQDGRMGKIEDKIGDLSSAVTGVRDTRIEDRQAFLTLYERIINGSNKSESLTSEPHAGGPISAEGTGRLFD